MSATVTTTTTSKTPPTHRLDVPVDATCRACGYALVGLVECRCPECGGAFDPDDPRTYRVPRPPGAWLDAILDGLARLFEWLWHVAVAAIRWERSPDGGRACAAALAAVMGLGWQLVGAPRTIGFLGFYGTILWIGVAVALALAVPDGAWRRASWWVAAGLLAVTVIGNVGLESCPHARYVHVGPAVFAIDGTACGNPRDGKLPLQRLVDAVGRR